MHPEKLLNMTSLLRGKQSGIQNDLSAGLDASFFKIDDIARFGKDCLPSVAQPICTVIRIPALCYRSGVACNR